MNKNYKMAVASYKSVLKWASEYHDKKVHVDTLLQIHAVHNMLDIIGHLPQEENVNKTQYEQKLTELEWKYIETYKDKVKEVEDRLLKVQREVKELECNSLSEEGDAWWCQVLYGSEKANKGDVLIEKLTLEMQSTGMQFAAKTVKGVDMILTKWIEKVNAGRRKTLKHFQDLSYFHGNLKPKNKMTEDELFKIEYLVQTSYQCHLLVTESASSENDDQTAGTCQMCRTKQHLDQYECVIFNKFFLTDNETRGTWNPCKQEYIFKILLAYAKRSNFDRDIISAGETELKLLEGFKNEFKEYSQYWVEINYTVSAYDELNMCKSRLTDVDMMEDIPESADVRRSNMCIPRNMIREVQHEMYLEKESAELNFVRIRGRLKYLEHLKENEKPDPCPICKREPEERYAVLQCGHSLCFLCVNQMARYQRNNISCALCRHKQLYRDVFYVTLGTEVCEEVGNFSPKILRIIREILRIRNEEPTVKIVIFSQWDNILYMIKQALETNKISHVMHRQASSRVKSMIQCFKEGPETCLLLPLAAGSKGLNLTEATHVFLVEPILNPSEELQAIGRVHRIGQTKPTFVHRFIMTNTIEQTIYNTVTNDSSGIWNTKNIKVEDLKKLFELPREEEFSQTSSQVYSMASYSMVS